MADADTAEVRRPAFEVGKRYRDTATGHHVLFLYEPLRDPAPEVAHLNDQWGYTVTSNPDGTLSEDIGDVRWTGPDARYLELPDDIGVVIAELRNVIGLLFDEVDPSADGDWGNDRLPALALAACILFERVDSHLQDGGSLPFEWNPYVAAQPCHVSHTLCEAHTGTEHCRCMKRRCDGRHKCACGHTWETPQG